MWTTEASLMWLSAKADGIQDYVEMHDYKQHYYDTIKAIYGPQSSGSSSRLDADGTKLLAEKTRMGKTFQQRLKPTIDY